MSGTMRPLLFLKSCLWAAVLSSYYSCNRGGPPPFAEGLTFSLILYAGAVVLSAPQGVSKPGVAGCPGPLTVRGIF